MVGDEPSKGRKPEQREDDDRFACTRCDRVFDSNADLQKHRHDAHGVEIAEALKKADPEVKRIQRM